MTGERKIAPVTTQGILVTLLIVASFLLGSLFTKVKYLERGATVASTAGSQQQQPAAVKRKYNSFDDALKALAKEAKVNEKKFLECVSSDAKKSVVDADTSQGNSVGVSGTPAFFTNGRLLAGAYPLEEFKKLIDEELAGKADPSVTRVKIDLGNASTRGASGAPITFVEFSDFECPFCARAYPTVKQVLDAYKGKILFVYKHFPLTSIHPRAQKMAEASECARDQGKFWEFHDAVFENQGDWAGL